MSVKMLSDVIKEFKDAAIRNNLEEAKIRSQ
jgi:hypothetical protein